MRPTIGQMTTRNPLNDPALAGDWTCEPERSSLRFISKTLWGLVPVSGRFTDLTGQARITPDGRLSGRLVIRAESIRTGIGMRDRHLRAHDFFDVADHPEIVADISGAGDELSCELTIRGITLPVPLQITAERQGDAEVKVSARGEVDRTSWGVSGNMLGMMPPHTTLLAEAVFVR